MKSLLRRLYFQQEGQALYLVGAGLIVILGMAALSIDIGFLLHAQRELQASTDASATAGALDISNNLTTTAATNDAYCYSGIGSANFGGSSRTCANGLSESSGLNLENDLRNVTMVSGYPAFECLTVCSTGQTTGCVPGATIVPTCDNNAGANAIAVRQTVNAPTFFGKLFGIPSVKLTASAFALEKGSTPIPANVMIIVDSTASMSGTDTKCTVPGLRSATREDCSKAGVATLLGELSPCAPTLTGSNCGTLTGSNVQNPYDVVGILTFPGLSSTSDDQYEYDCQAKSICVSGGGCQIPGAIAQYAAPGTTPPNYTVVPFSSDYRASNTATSLSTTSDLVQSVTWLNGCQTSAYGLQDPGGVHTYYAGIITEAQSDLAGLGTIGTSNRTKMQNVMIILSDGGANASGTSDFTSASLKANPSLDVNECQQAITAAQNAAKAGTWVYSVAYGSSTATGGGSTCTTDSSRISACYTMTNMASSLGNYPDASKFYSDDADGCTSTAHPDITSISTIFQAIGYDLESTRLLSFSLYVP